MSVSFNNSFGSQPVQVEILAPIQRTFTINGGIVQKIPLSLLPADYIMKFTKRDVTANANLYLNVGDTVNFGDYFTSASSGDDFVRPQTKCKIVNDTLYSATVRLEYPQPDVVPVFAIPVNGTIELLYRGDTRRSFTVTVNGKAARVVIKGRDEPLVALYLTSIFPNPLHAAVEYFVDNQIPGETEVVEVKMVETTTALESYV
ncbi:uncharacterized protein PHACADRAFT_252726 [Phanerochaete carnosa HHB-10118-sp]|uniref:Uncharacterized protein n=1 Tax=Phanerochaete carnosa (strain HHB-10118-sp) TaxID=650164 RepID=K5WH46_PHACS|nr:uncharacterized protein PHACADRAFT_252726 [Phanerochaete carnosa HHB-10118-sp]EKM58419.1 hypothetical protein PHACADRAFT_252726 [Phanerochaete carnosa HHB-10118-sp]